jgi:transcriptional regulator with XRE-family HTH domain
MCQGVFAMPRKSFSPQRNENRERLAKLVREALKTLNMPKGEVAKKAGITPSHLSHVLRKAKSLSKEKLLSLGDVLKIPRDQILSVAGFAASEESGIDLGNVTLVRSLGGPRMKVVTDPRFIDSAIFMWIFSTQPFREIGIEWDLANTDWGKVAPEVASQKYAVGFYNRKAVVSRGTKPLYNVKYWTDLCLYKGYALLARPNDRERSGTLDLDRGRKYLRALIKRSKDRRPIIVSMGTEPVWRLMTSLVPELIPKNFKVDTYANPDFALNQFLKEKVGDLYVGGLPQRLFAKEEGCVEVLSFENNPLLFSLNSLICSEEMVESQKPILSTISSLWFHTVGRMKREPNFRALVVRGIQSMLIDLKIDNHNLRKEYFDMLFSETDDENAYESFPNHPSELLDEVMGIFPLAFERLKKIRVEAIVTAFLETLNPRLDKEEHSFV